MKFILKVDTINYILKCLGSLKFKDVVGIIQTIGASSKPTEDNSSVELTLNNNAHIQFILDVLADQPFSETAMIISDLNNQINAHNEEVAKKNADQVSRDSES